MRLGPSQFSSQMDESLKLDIFKVAFSICDGQPSGGPTNEEGEEEGWRGKGEEGNGREWKWGVMRRGEETELSLNEKKNPKHATFFTRFTL